MYRSSRYRAVIQLIAGVAASAFLLLVPSTTSAHWRGWHPNRYRPAPPPPPPAPAPAASPAEEDLYLLGIGVRVSGIAVEGYKLHLSDIENPIMGGVGIQFRSKFSRYWGLELAADYLRGGDGDFVQWTVPVSLSMMFFLFPDSRINPYGLFGGGVHFTSLEYQGGLFTYDLVEVAGHLGAGVQVRLGESFAIHTDVRFMGIYKNLGEEYSIRNDCLSAAGGNRGLCAGLDQIDPNDKFNIGLQFQLGATYFF